MNCESPPNFSVALCHTIWHMSAYTRITEEALMSTKNWVIIGKGDCSWCDKTKALLHEYGIEFRYLDAMADTGIMDFLVASGLLTVPQVYQNGHHVGGYEGTRDYLEWLQLPRNP